MPQLIDAHCHLEQSTYGSELDDVLQRATLAEISPLIAVGASRTVQGALEVVGLCETYPNVYAAVGIHPEDAEVALLEPSCLDVVSQLLAHPKVVCVGEIGLDYHYPCSKTAQADLLIAMVALAKQADLPIMLHIRDAFADCLALIDQCGWPRRGGMVHCFTGSADELAACVARGLMISVSGVVTFKKSTTLRQTLRHVPLSNLLIETDSPYLTPVPHRGKRNEPALVRLVAETMASLLDMSLAQLSSLTLANSRAFFRLP